MKHLILLMISLSFVLSQSDLFHPLSSKGNELSLSFEHPVFKNSDDDFSMFSGQYELSGVYHTSDDFAIEMNLPISFFGVDNVYLSYDEVGSISEFRLNNIYLGARSYGSENMSYSFGAYLPTSHERAVSALMISTIGDYLNIEKYYTNAISLVGKFTHNTEMAPGTILGYEISPLVLIPTGNSSREVELLLGYQFGFSHHIENLGFGAVWQGKMIVTEDPNDFSDRFINGLQLNASYNINGFVPALYYRFTMDDEIDNYVSGAFGMNLSTTF